MVRHYRLGKAGSFHTLSVYGSSTLCSSSFLEPGVITDILEREQELGRKDLTVCFTGHRHLSAEARKMLDSELDDCLEALYRCGYRDFISGAAVGFDTAVASSVMRLTAKHPDARLILAIPCADQSRGWTDEDVRRYQQLIYAADETHVLFPEYHPGCMHARNRYMVDRSALVVALMHHLRGGTLYTVNYALKQDVPVVNLAIPGSWQEFTAR